MPERFLQRGASIEDGDEGVDGDGEEENNEEEEKVDLYLG